MMTPAELARECAEKIYSRAYFRQPETEHGQAIKTFLDVSAAIIQSTIEAAMKAQAAEIADSEAKNLRLAKIAVAYEAELTALRRLADAVRKFDAAWGTGGDNGAAERFAARFDV